jgi:CDGSH-type Zn-finger protein
MTNEQKADLRALADRYENDAKNYAGASARFAQSKNLEQQNASPHLNVEAERASAIARALRLLADLSEPSEAMVERGLLAKCGFACNKPYCIEKVRAILAAVRGSEG